MRRGRFPHELDISEIDLAERSRLVSDLEEPADRDEAIALVTLFGEDSLYGLAWSLVTLIESAPGWPYWEVLEDPTNEWVDRLRRRAISVGQKDEP